jgi:hypothetical protein
LDDEAQNWAPLLSAATTSHSLQQLTAAATQHRAQQQHRAAKKSQVLPLREAATNHQANLLQSSTQIRIQIRSEIPKHSLNLI